MNHETHVRSAIDRSRSRRIDAEQQLRSLRGRPLDAAFAELDGLLVHEVRLETRLTEVLNRNLADRAG
jgi:hypothetical protein